MKSALVPLTLSELECRSRLSAHVQMLAGTIGGRDAVRYEGLRRAASYIQTELRLYALRPERISGKEISLPAAAGRWPAIDRTRSPHLAAQGDASTPSGNLE